MATLPAPWRFAGRQPRTETIAASERPRGAVHNLHAAQRLLHEEALLVLVEREVVADVVMHGQQKAARAAGGIVDQLARLRSRHIHDGLDQSARREVLAGAALHVAGVLFQQPLVGVALHVHAQRGPCLAVDQVGDQALQLCGVLDAVLRLAEDGAQHAGLLAQLHQNVPVVLVQIVAIEALQTVPVERAANQYGPIREELCRSSAIFRNSRNVSCSM